METTNNASGRSELDDCPRCFELEEKCKKAAERCGVLELEIKRNKCEFESFESKLAILTLDKLAFEDEVHILEKRNKELQNQITEIKNCNKAAASEVKGTQDVDLMEEGDKISVLMVENNVLNAEVGALEARCKDLELQVAELEKSLCSKHEECALTGVAKVGLVSSGGGREISEVNELQSEFHGAATPVIDTLFSNVAHVGAAQSDTLHEHKVGCVSRARKQLVFEEGTPGRKMVPKTPTSVRPPPVCIDISDSDVEATTTNLPVLDIKTVKKASALTDSVGVVSMDAEELTSKNNLTWSPDQSEEDDVPHCNRRASLMSNTKRKRAFNVVTSDSGSDTDDNLPICRLRTDYPPESVVPSLQKSNCMTGAASRKKNGQPIPRRRLVPLRRKQHKEGTSKKLSYGDSHSIKIQSLCGIPTNETFTGDETEEDESDAEDESLDSFIVGSSDSEGNNASKVNDISTSEERSTAVSDDASDSNMDYGDIISRIGRRKDHLIKWVFEADMLADFGKDPELCMKAVCALYRRQTSEEKLSKATIFANQRGFSQCDAVRGSKLGEFLTDGDPLGDLRKSVKELREHDPKGVELCRTLATHYSKQLFAMYENKEDPLWPALQPN